MTQKLLELGFEQGFPFVQYFTKKLDDISIIKINVNHLIKNGDKLEDVHSNIEVFAIAVTYINLPNSTTKFFKIEENALNFTNQLIQQNEEN